MNIIKPVIHLISKVRFKLYDWGILKSYSFGVPVISIGNISMGGTGKTPMVGWVVNQILLHNKKPCVITRGYNRKSNKMIIINNNENNKYTLDQLGDEPFSLLKEYPNITMVIGDNKVEAINVAVNELDIDVVILDDGFQSLYIKRDLDVVMINAGDKSLVTRESLSSVSRSDVIIFKPFEGCSFKNYRKILNKIRGEKILKIRAQALFSIEGGNNMSGIKKTEPMIAVCGIGDSVSFKKSLINNNIIIKELLTYGDHYNYTADDMRFIYNKMTINDCQTIITTTKDYYKLNVLNKSNKKIIMLKIKFDFLETAESGCANKEELINLLKGAIAR